MKSTEHILQKNSKARGICKSYHWKVKLDTFTNVRCSFFENYRSPCSCELETDCEWKSGRMLTSLDRKESTWIVTFGRVRISGHLTKLFDHVTATFKTLRILIHLLKYGQSGSTGHEIGCFLIQNRLMCIRHPVVNRAIDWFWYEILQVHLYIFHTLLTTRLRLVSRSKNGGAVPPLPQYAFMAWWSVRGAHGQLYFTLLTLYFTWEYRILWSNFMFQENLRFIFSESESRE